jgi:Peroxiredoxin
MSTTTQGKGTRSGQAAQAQRVARARARARRRLLLWVVVGTVAAGLGLFAISASRGGSGSGGGPRFDVGEPGPGAEAPPIRLASTAGGTYDLAAARGRTVLLYFQEGLMCQPCWNQIRDIERNWANFQALGIDEMVSISSDDVDLLQQKMADEDLKTPGLADPQLSLAESYEANQYGMMGESTYGHSFIVVGPDGRIRWRADYGGAPDHTMYVEPDALLDDLRAGLDGKAAAES